MYFYQDKSKREIDLLMETGTSIEAYEIKSATVFHNSFFKNLDYFQSLYGDDVKKTCVIYDGEYEDDSMINYRHMD